VKGSKSFSGSLTINATPTMAPGQSLVTENGSDVSLTVIVGGQAINFVNSSQNPHAGVTFTADVVPTELEQPQGHPETEFFVTAGNAGNGITGTFYMSFYSLGVGILPANLASLPLDPEISSVGLSIGSSGGSSGVVTSIE